MWNPRDMKHWKKQSQPASDYYQHSGYTCAANRPQTKRSHRRLPLLGFLDTPHVHHQGPWATTKSATQTRAPQDDLGGLVFFFAQLFELGITQHLLGSEHVLLGIYIGLKTRHYGLNLGPLTR